MTWLSSLPGRALQHRLSLLLIALALGAGLVASGLRNYADARLAGESFAERQGVVLFRRLGLGPSQPEPALRALFARAIAEHEVNHLAFWRGGALGFAAGETSFPGLRPTPGRIQLNGDHARMSFSASLFKANGAGEQAPPGVDAAATEPVVVMEFDPVGTMDFAHRALFTLWLSGGAGLLLTAAALVVWSLGERSRRLQLEVEQQRRLATLGSLSAVLAHELKNPLAGLKGNTQLWLEDPHGPRARARGELVLSSVLRLEAVINDLLDFVRSGAIRPALASPARVLEAAVRATRPDSIELNAGLAPESWLIDANRMQQVLVNLLENALQATPPGERVRASVSQVGARLVYTVADRGQGVPSSERGRIFEPFYTTRIRGTGLGLAVAKRIVELHGGQIDLESPADGGACFRIQLPAARVRA